MSLVFTFISDVFCILYTKYLAFFIDILIFFTAYQYSVCTLTARPPVTLLMILSTDGIDLNGSSSCDGKLSCRLLCTSVTLHIAPCFTINRSGNIWTHHINIAYKFITTHIHVHICKYIYIYIYIYICLFTSKMSLCMYTQHIPFDVDMFHFRICIRNRKNTFKF